MLKYSTRYLSLTAAEGFVYYVIKPSVIIGPSNNKRHYKVYAFLRI